MLTASGPRVRSFAETACHVRAKARVDCDAKDCSMCGIG